MRLYVRATTVRAPTITPPSARIYALSLEGEADLASPSDPSGGLATYDREGEASTAILLYLNNDVEAEADRATVLILALSSEGEADLAAPGATIPTGYAYNRVLVIERHADLTAATVTNHVVRGRLSGDWLKQSTLTGGRIRNANCYDLIFETLDATPVRLDHEIEAYNGTAGTLDFALRLPSWAVTTDQFRARIRYGASL